MPSESTQEGIQRMKTLIIGIDAACSRVLDPLIESGAVPTIERCIDTGVHGDLESQIPPWTASAWPSLSTGTNPGKHGVFDFLAFSGYDWDVVNATDVREPTLWELLDEHDMRSVVVNVPVTHPPTNIDGAVVPGYTAPPEPDCHPAGILDDIREAIDEYRLYAEEKTPAEYCELIRMRGDAFLYLADRFEPEFGFLQFQGSDTVFHDLPGDEQAVEQVYRAIDKQINGVLGDCNPETVLIASDHGIGPYERYEFRVNEFLRREGYVETVSGGESGMPSWGAIRERRLDKQTGSERLASKFLSSLVVQAARVGLTSQRMGTILDRLGLTEYVLRVVPSDAVRAGTEQVDFARSAAYMRSRTELGIRLNVEGRDPEGVVPEHEYEAIREKIIKLLEPIETPDGEPVFEDVAPCENYFQGPHVEEGVDIVTVPHEFEQFLSARLLGSEFGEPQEPWNHKREGIIVATGAAVNTEKSLENAHIFDVAPTVLATLGLPQGERMDGDVLPIVESTGTQRYSTTRQERIETDSEAVEDRLSDLGYLE
jgi:predicted AlkP superfamily phosphohydrolase/phosphomutase